MKPVVKICCISSLQEAHLAIAAGAGVLGLVSSMPSGPGVIDELLIADIAADVKTRAAHIKTFLLTALTDAEAIVTQHARCDTTALQLVDHVPHDQLKALRRHLPHIELVQVIHVADQNALREAIAVAPLVDAILLDSGNPTLPVKELGGTGRTHDWRISRKIRESINRPLYLAGGLRPDNVRDAVAAVAPFGLDICSGLRSDGCLDATKVAEFFANL